MPLDDSFSTQDVNDAVAELKACIDDAKQNGMFQKLVERYLPRLAYVLTKNKVLVQMLNELPKVDNQSFFDCMANRNFEGTDFSDDPERGQPIVWVVFWLTTVAYSHRIGFMPRQRRVEYPGAMYHVMSRGDRRENIFLDDVDRHDFIKTLAEACQKTGWQMHAYCLMRNHYHLVLETPNANLVAGMAWLQSTYTIRLNHRHKLFGHVFSGRYKAQLVEGSGNGYLRTACDYVHLNPVRAGLLRSEDRLVGYPWSSLGWYLAAPEHRPGWMRVDRLLGEHVLGSDTAANRQEFERRMEARRLAETDEAALKILRRGWCLGGEEFRLQMLEAMEGKLGEHHSGELRLESAAAKAQRIIVEELARLGWTERELLARSKGDPGKLALAARLRRETTLTLRAIAARVHLGTSKSANTRLHQWMKKSTSPIQARAEPA